MGLRTDTTDLALIRSLTAICVAFVFCGRGDSHVKVLGTDLFLDDACTTLSFREREFKGKRKLTAQFRVRHFPIRDFGQLGAGCT